MADLRARTLERIDQLEALARAATPGPWRTGTHESSAQTVYDRDGDTLIYDEGGHSEDDAEHIATWNPQAVLTLCAGVRGLLDGHQPERGHLRKSDELACAACAEHGATVWPCADVELVARMLGIDPDA